ncbi:MAG: cytochrome c biogenesis protein CcsA [Planctomycetes bacterium]|nr:cytochrome c biogenesis protein CcsA [Planctomycetota bacterium]
MTKQGHLLLGILIAWGCADAGEAGLPGFDFTEIGKVLVQHKGRVKPLDTYAREVVSKVTGREKFRASASPSGGNLPGGDARAVFLSWTFESEKWQEARFIRVNYRPFKERIGLDPDEVYFSFGDLAGSESLEKLQRKVHAKSMREGEDAKLDRMEREVMDVAGKVELVHGLFEGYALAVIPHPSDRNGRWLPMPAVSQRVPEAAEAARSGVLDQWVAVGTAFRERRGVEFNQEASKLLASLNALFERVHKEETSRALSQADWETDYNRLHAFRFSAGFYFLGLVMFLISLHWRSGPFYAACQAVLGVGVLVQVCGFALRIYITQRPPVSNMYESMVFMGFMLTVFSIVFELVYRSRIFGIAASALSVMLLILADQLPLDRGMDPLVPVLRTNYWLTVHVLTVMSAYAALTLAMGVGHINLGIYFFAPHRKELLAQMTLFLYRSLQLGFLLITAGTILGAWWAGEAWGRYWGWDPKETWALICILGYGILLHGRMAGFWGPFGTAVGSVIAWSLVGMCYYGVNFVLGAGLHSYGFGDGGIQFAIGYLVVETLIVAASFYGRYGRKFPADSVHAAAGRGHPEGQGKKKDSDGAIGPAAAGSA